MRRTVQPVEQWRRPWNGCGGRLGLWWLLNKPVLHKPERQDGRPLGARTATRGSPRAVCGEGRKRSRIVSSEKLSGSMLLIEGYDSVRSRKIDSGRESISGKVVEGFQQFASSTPLPLPYDAVADDELENGLTHMCWFPNRAVFPPRVSVPLSVLPAHTPCIAPSGPRLRMLWWQSCGPPNVILPPHRVRCRQCYHLCL